MYIHGQTWDFFLCMQSMVSKAYETKAFNLAETAIMPIYSQTSIKRPLKGNVKSGLLKRWSLKKGLRV